MLCNTCQHEHSEGETCPRCPHCGRFAHPPKAGWQFGTCPSIMKGTLSRMGRFDRTLPVQISPHASRPRFRKG